MKTSTWVTLACIVITVAFVGLMLGLWAVPATEKTDETTSTSTVTSVSGGGSAKIQQNEPANVNRSENKPQIENHAEDQNEPAADNLTEGDNESADDLTDGESNESEKRGE